VGSPTGVSELSKESLEPLRNRAPGYRRRSRQVAELSDLVERQTHIGTFGVSIPVPLPRTRHRGSYIRSEAREHDKREAPVSRRTCARFASTRSSGASLPTADGFVWAAGVESRPAAGASSPSLGASEIT
jgi:hypothetical protein